MADVSDNLRHLLDASYSAVGRENFEARCLLAASRMSGIYFAGNQDETALTILSYGITIPPPEHAAIADKMALARGLRAIGFNLMRYECELGQIDAYSTSTVVRGELEDPVKTFGRTRLGNTTVEHQHRFPYGLGYITLLRAAEPPDGLLLGWCDPSDGRRCELPVDVARVRHYYPNLEPRLSSKMRGGGML